MNRSCELSGYKEWSAINSLDYSFSIYWLVERELYLANNTVFHVKFLQDHIDGLEDVTDSLARTMFDSGFKVNSFITLKSGVVQCVVVKVKGAENLISKVNDIIRQCSVSMGGNPPRLIRVFGGAN